MSFQGFLQSFVTRDKCEFELQKIQFVQKKKEPTQCNQYGIVIIIFDISV